ncbi:MAG: lysophospholipid acyltransferase family protein [bacterium]
MEDNKKELSYDVGLKPKEVNLKKSYRFYNRTFIFLFFSNIILFFSVFLWRFVGMLMGIKVRNKKYSRKVKGAVVVANHVFQIDAFLNVVHSYPKKTYVTSLKSNLGFPIVSRYIRLCAAVPIPETRELLRKFNKDSVDILKKDKRILFYAEANLIPFSDHIRPFQKGGFKYAVQADKPILPIVYTYRKPKGIFKWKKNPFITINYLPPIYANKELESYEQANELLDRTHKIMSDFFNEHSEIKKTD